MSAATKPKIDLSEHFVSHHTTMTDALKSDMPIRYVMSKDGVIQIRENEIGQFRVKATKIPGADNIKEGFQMNLPKIPYTMFLQILSFFRGVCDRFSNAEAAMQIFWDREKKEYFLYCPTQRVNGSNVNFDRNEQLESQHLLVMDIHSHNTMGAFFSGTDNNDEKETRLFGVIGKVPSQSPEVKFRIACGGNTIENLSMWDIFENPFGNVSVPEEWYGKVTKSTGNQGDPYKRYNQSQKQQTQQNGVKKFNGAQNHQNGKKNRGTNENGTSVKIHEQEDDVEAYLRAHGLDPDEIESLRDNGASWMSDEDESFFIHTVLEEFSNEGIALLVAKLATQGGHKELIQKVMENLEEVDQERETAGKKAN